MQKKSAQAPLNMQSILFLSVMNGDAWGGSEESWYRLALWMCKQEYKVAVCVFDWKDKENKLAELKENGCIIYLIPNNGNGVFKLFRQKILLNSIPYKKYDLVFVNQGGWKDIAHGPFKHLYKKLPQYALTFHNYHLGQQYPARKVAMVDAWIKNAVVSLADSIKIFSMLETEYAIHPANKEILYNPITFEPPVQPVSYYNPTDDQPWIIIMLAALDIGRKAQDLLIKAMARPEWKNRNWELRLYGEGRDKQLLFELIKNTQLENKVFLMGHSSAVKTVLAQSHLLMQVTHIDAMPISVSEAIAMSRPCIVSKVGDMPDWITDGYNGFICDSVTEDAIHETLERAWNKRTDWKQMGIAAHQTFIEKYPQPYEEKLLSLLNKYAVF